MNAYTEMTNFLSDNGINYSNLLVIKPFFVEYKVGSKNLHCDTIKVTFLLNHTEHTTSITIDIADNAIYTSFSYQYQNYKYNKSNNTLTISGSGPKHNEPYKVIIHGKI